MNKVKLLTSLTPLILKRYRQNELIKDIGIFIIGVFIGALWFGNKKFIQPQRPSMNVVAREQSKTDNKKEN